MSYRVFLDGDQRTKTWGKNQPVPKRIIAKVAREMEADRKKQEAAIADTTQTHIAQCPACQGILRELFRF